MPFAAAGSVWNARAAITTYERIDEVPYMVIKKDGRREKFDRQKVLGGLLKACEKRPVSMARLSELVNRVESQGERLAGSGDIYYRL